jgi:hypothetical protein
MSEDPSFEAYLISKKIDSVAFRNAEPEVWSTWKKEFEQIHPNSFTVQKLNLINPVRRKYLLQIRAETALPQMPAPSPSPPPKPGKPVMKPRPKID